MAVAYPTCLNALRKAFTTQDDLIAYCYSFASLAAAGLNELSDSQTAAFLSRLGAISFEGKRLVLLDSRTLRLEFQRRARPRG